jgi:hypothetical protein
MMPGPVGGQTDLLLVMPTLGEFTRSIKPVQRLPFSCPAHIEGRGFEWIKRLVKVGALCADDFHHVD